MPTCWTAVDLTSSSAIWSAAIKKRTSHAITCPRTSAKRTRCRHSREDSSRVTPWSVRGCSTIWIWRRSFTSFTFTRILMSNIWQLKCSKSARGASTKSTALGSNGWRRLEWPMRNMRREFMFFSILRRGGVKGRKRISLSSIIISKMNELLCTCYNK